jgi:outer membrane immunogenic protein
MYRVLIGAGIAAVIGSSVLAADLPPSAPVARAPAAYVPAVVPVYNWTGFYIGLNGGWGWASGTITDTIVSGPFSGATGTASGSINGGLFGGQIGANYQADWAVLGIEGDWDWSGQKRTDNIGCGVACTVNETIKIGYVATIRGRVGVAIDRVLVFGTGGVAFTKTSDNVTVNGGPTVFNASTTNTGWTAGVGAEFAFAQNWTAKVEYLYVGTKVNQSGVIPVVGGTLTESGNIHDSLIRVGVNFKYP